MSIPRPTLRCPVRRAIPKVLVLVGALLSFVTAPPAAPAGASSSGQITFGEAEGYWIAAGGSASVAPVAAAVAEATSSLQPGLIQAGVRYCGAGSRKTGWGLWRVACGDSQPQFCVDFELLSPWNNAEVAVEEYNAAIGAGKRGFSPWATYRSGAYKGFLPKDPPSPELLTDPGQFDPVGTTPAGTHNVSEPGSTCGPEMSSPVSPRLLVAVAHSGLGVGSGRVVIGPSGVACRDACSARYDAGSEVELTETRDPASFFVGWSGACSGTSTVCDLVMGSDATAVATFARIENSIAAAPNANGRLAIGGLNEVAGIDQKVQNRPNAPGFRPWSHLDADATSIALAANADGRLQLFYVTAAGGLYTRAQIAVNGAWGDEQSLGGNIAGPIAAARNSDGLIEVVAVGTDLKLYGLLQAVPSTSMWHDNWSRLEVTARSVALTANADGRLQLFYVAPSGGLYTRTQVVPGGGWTDSSEQSLGGDLIGPVAVSGNADGRLETLAVGTDARLYGIAQTAPNANSWGDWYSLDADARSVAIAANADGRLQLFYIGSSGALYSGTQLAPNGWWG